MTTKRPRGKIANIVAVSIAHAQAQPAFEFYASPPDPHEVAYQGFSLDTSEEEAAAAFQRRHEQPPAFVFVSLGIRLCGPKPSEVTRDTLSLPH